MTRYVGQRNTLIAFASTITCIDQSWKECVRMQPLGVYHIAFVVKSLEAARGFYERLGLAAPPIEEDAVDQLRCCCLMQAA